MSATQYADQEQRYKLRIDMLYLSEQLNEVGTVLQYIFLALNTIELTMIRTGYLLLSLQ